MALDIVMSSTNKCCKLINYTLSAVPPRGGVTADNLGGRKSGVNNESLSLCQLSSLNIGINLTAECETVKMPARAPYVVPALKKHTATVIMAHGLGDRFVSAATDRVPS